MSDTFHLLRAWAERRSEEAFAQLVARHIDLVYSVAVRKVAGDTGLAADIAQTVFADLARKARSLGAEGSLAGWLHRHTCYVAATALRGELRRRKREQTAAAMHALDNSSSPDWSHLAPLLDDAVNALGDADRSAILLRFYEQRDLRTVGSILGISDDTAQKRVSRALEKLRDWLARRGVTSTSAAIAAMLGAHGVSAAPAGLAASVASTAIAGTAAGTGVTLTLLELVTHAKAKLAAAIAVSAVVATPLVWQENAIAKVHAENRALADQTQTSDPIRAQPGEPVASTAADDSVREREDLERLRREVASLRSQLQEARDARVAAANAPAPQSRPAVALPPGTLALQTLQDVGTATSGHLVQTFFWAMFTVNTNRVLEICDWSAEGADKEAENMIRSAARMVAEGKTERRMLEAAFRPVREVPLENGDTAVVIEMFEGSESHRTALRVRRVGNEWRMVMGRGGPQEEKLSKEQLRD